MDRRFQLGKQRAHHILHGTESRPGLRRAAHVVQNQAGVVLHDGFSEIRLPCQRRDIVDDGRAVFSAFSATPALYVSTEIGMLSLPFNFFSTGTSRRSSSPA